MNTFENIQNSLANIKQQLTNIEALCLKQESEKKKK